LAQFGLEMVAPGGGEHLAAAGVEAALDKRTSMGVIGNLNAYAQFQAANAMNRGQEPRGWPGGGGVGRGDGFDDGQSDRSEPARPGSGRSCAGRRSSPAAVAVSSELSRGDDMASRRAFRPGGACRPSVADVRQLTAQTLVWKAGMAQWTKAGSVPELGGLFCRCAAAAAQPK